MFRDVLALLRFAAANGFLRDALIGLSLDRALRLPATALARRLAALRRRRDDRQARGRRIDRLARAFQHRAQSVADDVRRAARVFAPIIETRSDAKLLLRMEARLGLIAARGSPRRTIDQDGIGPVAESVDARAVHRSLSWFKSRPGLQPSRLRQLRLGRPLLRRRPRRSSRSEGGRHRPTQASARQADPKAPVSRRAALASP